MIPFRFLHAADLHLDSPFQGLSAIAPVLRESLQNATFQAFERLVDLCLTRKVDALLIAGDLHNAVDRSLRALTRMRDQFHRLQANGIAVFLCHGNHDPLCGWEARFTWPDNVHVFGTAEVAARPLLKNGAEAARVLGISYGRERVEENLALQFTREKDAPWSIALLHTNVGHDRNHANYAPCKLSDLLQSGMDYWALGHIHTHRVLHSGNPVVLYPGNPQGRHPREPGPRGCYIVDVDARGTAQYEFIPVDVVRWHHVDLSIDGLSDLGALFTKLETHVERLRSHSDERGSIVRWTLHGRGPVHRELSKPGRLDDVLATTRERSGDGLNFVWSESIQDRTGRPVDLDELRRRENLLGDFLRLSAESHPTLLQDLRASLHVLFHDPRIRRYRHFPDDDHLRQWVLEAEQQGVDRLLPPDD